MLTVVLTHDYQGLTLSAVSFEYTLVVVRIKASSASCFAALAENAPDMNLRISFCTSLEACVCLLRTLMPSSIPAKGTRKP